jgi:hypothetical protein
VFSSSHSIIHWKFLTILDKCFFFIRSTALYALLVHLQQRLALAADNSAILERIETSEKQTDPELLALLQQKDAEIACLQKLNTQLQEGEV